MENKNMKFQMIIERLACDAELREKVLSTDIKGFTAMLNENGITNVEEGDAKELLDKVHAIFTSDTSEISSESLAEIAGGRAYHSYRAKPDEKSKATPENC